MDLDLKTVQQIIGMTLENAIAAKRIFIVDLAIMHELLCKDNNTVCAPIALFFLDKKDTLLPLAIQLYQVAAEDNPVFYKSDPPATWALAKLWYNLADASFHQSCSHLGFTHLIMEGFAICTQRNLSSDHPVHKLLAPHFLYLIAINSAAVETLISPGGWVDKVTSTGVVGMFDLIRRQFETWRLDTNAVPPVDFARRGVETMPTYPYRDDAVLIYSAITTYVKTIIDHFYDKEEKLVGDYELQKWATELVRERTRGGCGIKGLPGDGKYTNKEDLITTISAVIYTCSATHAAANFQQYDEYGFPPNYPLFLQGQVPTKKDGYTHKDLVDALPSRKMTLDTITVTTILSRKGTKSLGDFEVQYLYDPVSLQAGQAFRDELQRISQLIKDRNKDELYKYPFMDPENIPNAISI
jgi:arachidonate 5-lipoxygenase